MGNPVIEDLQPKQLPAPHGGAPKQQVQVAGPRNRHATPIFLILFGLGLLLLGVSTSMFDIQATEGMVSGVTITTFVPNWQTLGQPFAIIAGQPLPANVAASYYVGWIVELASIILVVGFDLALEAIWHAPNWVSEAFKWSIYAIAAADVITNYMFEPLIANWFVRLFVAALIAVSSFFFPIIGVLCLERGVKSW